VLLAALTRSDWIALGAVLIAGGALMLAIFALVLAWRADARAGRAGQPDPGEESADGHLDVVPVETETGRAELRLTAGLAVPDGSDRRRYAVTVRNAGRGRADEVRVTVENEQGETVSEASPLPPLSLAGGESGETAAWVPRAAARPGLCFAVSWRDDRDNHVRTEVALPF
jgi:hypothetical protein